MENQVRFEIVPLYSIVSVESEVAPEESGKVCELKGQIETLEKEVEVLRLNINRKMGKIKKFNAKKQSENKETIESIIRMRQELKDVEAEIEAWLSKDMPKVEPVFEDIDDETFKQQWKEKFGESKWVESKPKASKKDAMEIKKLYRWIASRCHPDKTKDPEKHLMFLKAKEYRDAGDLQGLKDIVHLLKTGRSRLLDAMLKRLQELYTELFMLQIRDGDLGQHEDFIAAEAFLYHPTQVMELIRESYLRTHREVAIKLSTKQAHLRDLKGEGQPKKTHGFTTFNFE